MEYEILTEEIREEIKTQLDERSVDWTLQEWKNLYKNYSLEELKLKAQIKLQEISVRLYKENPAIARPVFEYEKSEEYAEALRDQKLPDMEAELNQNKGKLESTTFQLGLMKDKIKVLEIVEEK